MPSGTSLAPALALVLALLAAVPAGAAGDTAGRPERGAVLDAATLTRYGRDAIEAGLGPRADFIGRPSCDVTLIDLTYATVGVTGGPATASAMLLLPEGDGCPGPHPLLGWGRGTEMKRDSSQARELLEAGDSPLLTFFAAHGYAVVATDYLGLGRSDHPFHPYLHADTEASSIIDALRAAREAGGRRGFAYSGKVMLAGYSQGGHAAMAAQREIERSHADEFELVATAPMSGPYALEQTFISEWTGTGPHGDNDLAPVLFAYAVVGMQRTYGDIYGSADEVFHDPYAGRVEDLMPGPYGLFEMLKLGMMPGSGRGIDALRREGFAQAFLRDPGMPFRRALARNDLLDWAPRTPTLLCGASRDAVVEFENARTAQAAFARRGVEVPVVDVADRIPPSVDGVSVHTHAASYLCLGAVREMLLDPAR
jgi:pimeloyl-ACP methyl ester carboxylesterase